jgi:peptidoglycan-associated lipoprotein
MKKYLKVAFLGVFVLLSAVNCQNKKVSATPGGGSSGGLRSVYFDFDESFVRNDQAQVLQSNGSYLKGSSGMVTIEGHCDERGTNEYNLALGQRRADTSRDYLTNLGVNSSVMRTVSYGEEKQVCFEHDENCWWKNRRVDFRK